MTEQEKRERQAWVDYWLKPVARLMPSAYHNYGFNVKKDTTGENDDEPILVVELFTRDGKFVRDASFRKGDWYVGDGQAFIAKWIAGDLGI